MLTKRGLFALAVMLGGGSAHAEERTHDEPFIAIDLGAEAGADVEATAGLIVGVESSSNNFLVSAAVTRGHSKTSFADVAFGYYRSFHVGWLTPELGVELGLVNAARERDGQRTHHVELLERIGGALLHDFENHVFAGVVSDVNFAANDLANVRALLEVGFRL